MTVIRLEIPNRSTMHANTSGVFVAAVSAE